MAKRNRYQLLWRAKAGVGVMERRIGVVGVVVVLMALVMLPNHVSAQRYTCWGGCYNDCFLRSNKPRAQMLGCYYQCLNNCAPRSASGYQYYCQVGCSLQLCRPVSEGGERLERCYGRCSNLCKP